MSSAGGIGIGKCHPLLIEDPISHSPCIILKYTSKHEDECGLERWFEWVTEYS